MIEDTVVYDTPFFYFCVFPVSLALSNTLYHLEARSLFVIKICTTIQVMQYFSSDHRICFSLALAWCAGFTDFARAISLTGYCYPNPSGLRQHDCYLSLE
ncbi:hypothetical protein DFH29DRAFT_846022 [Suillus ampliporus]|nr:hypothetical protein DFH29DRAFT_846022 [Suillus ampliporus]